jgi:hypothetical protein
MVIDITSQVDRSKTLVKIPTGKKLEAMATW